MNRIKYKTKLICPDSDIKDYILASDVSFWIDNQNVWNVECSVCGGQHNLDDMIEEEVKPSPTVTPERLAEIMQRFDNKYFAHEKPLSILYFKLLSINLSNILDIREKEQPCCDSPGKEKCMQCQELDRRD